MSPLQLHLFELRNAQQRHRIFSRAAATQAAERRFSLHSVQPLRAVWLRRDRARRSGRLQVYVPAPSSQDAPPAMPIRNPRTCRWAIVPERRLRAVALQRQRFVVRAGGQENRAAEPRIARPPVPQAGAVGAVPSAVREHSRVHRHGQRSGQVQRYSERVQVAGHEHGTRFQCVRQAVQACNGGSVGRCSLSCGWDSERVG